MGEPQTLIAIGFVIQNLGEAALHFDEKQLVLDEVVLNDRAEYLFSVPGESSPSDVRSYRVAGTGAPSWVRRAGFGR